MIVAEKYYLQAIILLITAIIAGCSGGDSGGSDLAKEMAARKLGERAKHLERAEQPVEAAKLFNELTEKYDKTKYYAELQKEMEQTGISIKDPLTSHTAIRMYKLQSLIVSYKATTGSYPKGHVISIPKDMWGTTIKYKIMDDPSKEYEFYVLSLGPDKKENTEDDIYVVFSGERSSGTKKKMEDRPVTESTRGRVSYSEEMESARTDPDIRGRAVNIEQLEKIMSQEIPADASSQAPENRKSPATRRRSGSTAKPDRSSGDKEIVVTIEELLEGVEKK
ncbi:MAG: type II secretion system protein GspG [Nitrospinota bacterium]